jgi:hypothetical protein
MGAYTFLLNKAYLKLAMLLNLVFLPVIVAEYKRANLLEPYAMFASPVDPLMVLGFMAHCFLSVSLY